jgi:hypothetical protein
MPVPVPTYLPVRYRVIYLLHVLLFNVIIYLIS